MTKERELWHFVADRLGRREHVMLLVAAESSGSSPGRQGYKMAVSSDGELIGSIGGGVMEVNLVEQSREILSGVSACASGFSPQVKEQVHRRDTPNSSGMICSGRQTLIFKLLAPTDRAAALQLIISLEAGERPVLLLTPSRFDVSKLQNSPPEDPAFEFNKLTDVDFIYREVLGPKNDLFIIGGGHCALALSELMSKLDFRISIWDDRPALNTLQKNEFADSIEVVESYDRIKEHITSSSTAYVVVMTLGYISDAVVIRGLIDKDFKYFGVLGSKAKMATLMKELRSDGLPVEKLDSIHTPIGLPINSRTPEEIAVSIAAQIISIKNSANR